MSLRMSAKSKVSVIPFQCVPQSYHRGQDYSVPRCFEWACLTTTMLPLNACERLCVCVHIDGERWRINTLTLFRGIDTSPAYCVAVLLQGMLYFNYCTVTVLGRYPSCCTEVLYYRHLP